MLHQENVLKKKLTKIKQSSYLLGDGDNYFTVCQEMMDKIGSIDPELRDDLIYDISYHWILDGKLSGEQLKELLEICLDEDHLFYKLGEKGEDGVFKRTFSVLIVALIIYQYRKENFLSETILFELKDKLIEYMNKEKDVRGYVEGKGWAHSAAHTADAIDELVQCTCFDKDDLLEVLEAIKAKVCIGYYVYIDEESERMVTAVESAFNRKLLKEDEMIEWLQGFIIKNQEDSYINKFHLKVNIKGFLRSLYFRLIDTEDSKIIVEEIKKLLGNL